MKKSQLKRVSKKQQARLRIYYKLRADYLAQHPVCEVCGGNGSQDIHHMGGANGVKRGSNLNNVDTWMAVCRSCHQKIEDNKSWAREMGYLR